MDNLAYKTGICYYNRGIDMVDNNDITAAVEYFERSLKYFSKNEKCLNILGLCYYTLGVFDRALALWKASLEIHWEDNESEKYIGSLYSEDFKNYTNAYNKCLELIEKDKYSEALRCIAPYNGDSPYLINALNLSGLLYYKLGVKQEAFNLWKSVLRHDASNKAAIAYIRDGETGGKGGIVPGIGSLLSGVLEYVWKKQLL